MDSEVSGIVEKPITEPSIKSGLSPYQNQVEAIRRSKLRNLGEFR